MTKEEFIQEAALRFIAAKPEASINLIASLARQLADKIYQEDETPKLPMTIEPDNDKFNAFDNEPIDKLLNNIDTIDEYSLLVYKSAHKGTNAQKKGLAKRLSTVCSVNNINTIGDLLKIGKERLRKYKNIGKDTIKAIDEGIYVLYNIEEW